MRVLGIETATPSGSVALVDETGLVAEVTLRVPRRHLEWLIPAIDRLVQDAAIDRREVQGVAVSQGPGGFTGLRIGIATATAWARAMDVPVVGVSTLEALAVAAGGVGLVVPVLDAKRGEVAAALFRREEDLSLTRLREDALVAPAAVGQLLGAGETAPPEEPVLLLGDGLARYAEALRGAIPRGRVLPQVLWTPRAALVAALGRERLARGQRDDPYRLSPIYGRRPYVEQMG